MFTFLRFLRLRKTPVWSAAKEAVEKVIWNQPIQHAAAKEQKTSFCPRCGQIPDGDRRMDEARQHVFEMIPEHTVSRSEVDFCLSFHYWKRKMA